LKGSLFGRGNEFLDVFRKNSTDKFNFIGEKNKLWEEKQGSNYGCLNFQDYT